MITNKKEEFGNTYTFYETINTLSYDMFFAPVPRLGIQLENKILDFEDVYTAKLTEFGEDESIEDKMLPFRKESEDRRARQQWLPYAEAYFGCMVYDVDLFEEKEFFIAKDGIGSDGKITAWTGTGISRRGNTCPRSSGFSLRTHRNISLSSS